MPRPEKKTTKYELGMLNAELEAKNTELLHYLDELELKLAKLQVILEAAKVAPHG